MSQRHTIRLRGPWWAVASCTGDGGATEDFGVKEALGVKGVKAVTGENDGQFKTTIPFSWPEQISSDFAGTIRLLRKFNCSAGMSEANEVWLTISSLGVPAEVLLNGETVGTSNPNPKADIEFAVSAFLKPFNELVILLEVQSETPSVLLGDVAIEI